MQAYQARLDSFSKTKRVKSSSGKSSSALSIKWPHPSHFASNPTTLAEAGFYFSPTREDRDNVQCFMCDKELSEWQEDDDPFDIHWTKCRASCAWALLRCGLDKDVDGDGNFTFPDHGRLPSKKTMEKARVATFLGWPHDAKTHGANPKKMAQAGFIYAPQTAGDDTAACLYCDVALSGWDKDDDPFEEHRKRDKRANTPCAFLAHVQPLPISSNQPAPPSKSSSAPRPPSRSKKGNPESEPASDVPEQPPAEEVPHQSEIVKKDPPRSRKHAGRSKSRGRPAPSVAPGETSGQDVQAESSRRQAPADTPAAVAVAPIQNPEQLFDEPQDDENDKASTSVAGASSRSDENRQQAGKEAVAVKKPKRGMGKLKEPAETPSVNEIAVAAAEPMVEEATVVPKKVKKKRTKANDPLKEPESRAIDAPAKKAPKTPATERQEVERTVTEEMVDPIRDPGLATSTTLKPVRKGRKGKDVIRPPDPIVPPSADLLSNPTPLQQPATKDGTKSTGLDTIPPPGVAAKAPPADVGPSEERVVPSPTAPKAKTKSVKSKVVVEIPTRTDKEDDGAELVRQPPVANSLFQQIEPPVLEPPRADNDTRGPMADLFLPPLAATPVYKIDSLSEKEMEMTVEDWIRHEIGKQLEQLELDGERAINRFKDRAVDVRRMIEVD